MNEEGENECSILSHFHLTIHFLRFLMDKCTLYSH